MVLVWNGIPISDMSEWGLGCLVRARLSLIESRELRERKREERERKRGVKICRSAGTRGGI